LQHKVSFCHKFLGSTKVPYLEDQIDEMIRAENELPSKPVELRASEGQDVKLSLPIDFTF